MNTVRSFNEDVRKFGSLVRGIKSLRERYPSLFYGDGTDFETGPESVWGPKVFEMCKTAYQLGRKLGIPRSFLLFRYNLFPQKNVFPEGTTAGYIAECVASEGLGNTTIGYPAQLCLRKEGLE